MGARIEVAKVGELASGDIKLVEADGNMIVLLNVGGELYAIDDECTHTACSLSDGSLEDDVIECPCHGAQFNVKTGDVQEGPANEPIPTYPVQVDGDTVYVSLP